ncbi:MAG: ComF family protein [Hyphomicrobiaceae bacterium]
MPVRSSPRTDGREALFRLLFRVFGVHCSLCGSPASDPCPDCLAQSGFNGRAHRSPQTPAGLISVWFCAPHVTPNGDASALTTLLHRFKYGGDRRAGRILAAIFAGACSQCCEAGTIVVPVPADPSRLKARGFDQAGWLAAGLSCKTGSRMNAQLLRRLPTSTAQHGLNALARSKNLAGAFSSPSQPRLPSSSSKVLLVDDVMTTGATLNACAAALHEQGIERIAAAVLLYAQKPRR